MTDPFATIRPFLANLSPLLDDPSVSEIMANGADVVFIERNGRMEATDIRLDERLLGIAVRQIARRLGDDISEAQPILDSRLPDGSRVAVVIPPASTRGVALTIRKFRAKKLTVDELIRAGCISSTTWTTLERVIQAHQNVLISGGTGAGKTTFLNLMASFIPREQRIVVIEDTAEIRLEHPNHLKFEARREQNGTPAVTVRQLLKAAMRHRPDRVLVGEVRGAEAHDLLAAMNSGHSGSMSTIHANSCAKALDKLTDYCLEAGLKPYGATRSGIAHTIDFVVQMERVDGVRKVVEVVMVEGYCGETDTYRLRGL